MSKYFDFIDMSAYCIEKTNMLYFIHKDKNRHQLALMTAVSETNGSLGAVYA